MANQRIISCGIFEDDFVGGLSFFERLLWIGLFGAVADDQGRMMDSAALIRSRVFLYDTNVTDEMAERALVKMAKAGKITRYTADGKRLIQIENWWAHQKPSWANASKYPALDGWTDRVKMHVKDNKVVTLNWDKPGGREFEKCVPTQLPSELHSGIEEGEVKGKAEGEVKGEDEAEVEKFDGGSSIQVETLRKTFVETTKQPAEGPEADEALQRMVLAGITSSDIVTAFSEVQGRYKIRNPASIVTPASMVMQRRLAVQPVRNYASGKYADLIEC